MGTTLLSISALCALSLIILMHRIGIRKFTGYSVFADIVISGGLTILFLGTFTGMVTALIAAILVSLYLVFSKYVFGAEKYSLKNGWKRTD
jgi:hypothetical protein